MPVLYKSLDSYLEENFVPMIVDIVTHVEPDLIIGECDDTDDFICRSLTSNLDLCRELKLHPFQIGFLCLISRYRPFRADVWDPRVWILENIERIRPYLKAAVY